MHNLCRRFVKCMSYPISEHAKNLVLADTVLNFYALACAGAFSKVWVIPSQTMLQKLILAETVFNFYALACAGAYSKMWVIPDHAEKFRLAETVFNFYALDCAGAYSKVWVIPSQAVQKNVLELRRSSISMHRLVPEPTQKYELSQTMQKNWY